MTRKSVLSQFWVIFVIENFLGKTYSFNVVDMSEIKYRPRDSVISALSDPKQHHLLVQKKAFVKLKYTTAIERLIRGH